MISMPMIDIEFGMFLHPNNCVIRYGHGWFEIWMEIHLVSDKFRIMEIYNAQIFDKQW